MTIEYWWKDEFLSRVDVENFLSQASTQVAAESIWVPTIHLMNSGSEKIRYRPDPTDSVFLFPEGYVEAWITTLLTVGCDLNLYK